MGFTTGFTGGVTLTLSLTYLAVLAHQRNRQAQSDILRTQSNALNSLVLPRSLASPSPSHAELAARERADFVESAKRRWNAELEGAVRWAQTKDWDTVRESAESGLVRLVGGAAATPTGQEAGRDARQGVAAARESGDHAVAEARSALAHTREAVHVKTEGARAAVTKGVERGKEMIGKARASVGLAEERFETKVDAKLLHLSEIEKALTQRYEKSDVMSKSVEEVLSERYKPIDQRDNTQLRGI